MKLEQMTSGLSASLMTAVYTKSDLFKAEEQMLEVQIGMKLLQVKHF